MLKRFLIALTIFVGLIIPGALMMALLAASAYPASIAISDGYAVGKAALPAAENREFGLHHDHAIAALRRPPPDR